MDAFYYWPIVISSLLLICIYIFVWHMDYKMLRYYESKQVELLQDKNANPSDIKDVNNAISRLSEQLGLKTKNEDQDANYIIGLTVKYIEETAKKPIPMPTIDDNEWLDSSHSKKEFMEIMYLISPLLNETICKDSEKEDVYPWSC